MSKKKKLLIFGGGGLLLVVIVVLNVVGRGEGNQTVQVETVRYKDLKATVSATGRVVAKDEVVISSEVSAKIREVLVKEGDRVKKGQVLIRMDGSTYDAAVSQFSALLSSQRAQLRVAEANLAHSELLLRQQEELYARGLISREQYDGTRTAHEVNKAQVDAARDGVSQSEARLLEAQRELAKTVITAPLDGVVIGVRVEEGETVSGALNYTGTELLTVADLSAMEVDADVDETDVAMVSVGQPVDIELDAFPDSTFEGVVTEVGYRGTVTGGTGAQTVIDFPVVVEITSVSPLIRSGMTADVEITTATRDSILVVPLSSLVLRDPADTVEAGRGEGRRGGRTAESTDRQEPLEGVFVVRGGAARFAVITKGIADEQDVEVTSGLAQGDTVITGPFQVLRTLNQGAKVKTELSWSARRRSGGGPQEDR